MNVANNKKGLLYKNKLKKALLQLMEEGTDVDKITVTSICEKAEINRSTFYSHYSIPRDILDEIEADMLNRTSEFMRDVAHKEHSSLSKFLEYIKDNAEVFRVLFLYEKDSSFFEKLLHASLYNFEGLKVYFKDKKEYEFAKAYVAAGSRELINMWIKDDFVQDVDYIKDMILRVSERSLQAFT